MHTPGSDNGNVKSWVEVSGARLAANFRAVQQAAGDDAEVLAVIKADGYGHGAALCAPVLIAAGASWLGVTDVGEGAAVRAALGGNDARILVMCGMESQDARAVVAQRLTPVVWTAAHIEALDAVAGDHHRVSVHVEVDTGMARQGATVGAGLASVLAAIARSRSIHLEGVMTHLCCSDVAGATTTAASQSLFHSALEQTSAAGLQPGLVHIANTSAVDEGAVMPALRDLAAQFGARVMVRPGLALYGYCLPLESSTHAAALLPNILPVMRWKAPVIGIRDIEAGITVGYGATFVAARPMRLALLPVGYADGFRREASSGIGNGWVMIHGLRAPVVGRVSMNLTVVDVTGIEVVVGDEAVLLGEGVSAEDHAAWSGTIAYDILCGARGHRGLA